MHRTTPCRFNIFVSKGRSNSDAQLVVRCKDTIKLDVGSKPVGPIPARTRSPRLSTSNPRTHQRWRSIAPIYAEFFIIEFNKPLYGISLACLPTVVNSKERNNVRCYVPALPSCRPLSPADSRRRIDNQRLPQTPAPTESSLHISWCKDRALRCWRAVEGYQALQDRRASNAQPFV